jgi:hypothetical protein
LTIVISTFFVLVLSGKLNSVSELEYCALYSYIIAEIMICVG